jgi:hypothetical protein
MWFQPKSAKGPMHSQYRNRTSFHSDPKSSQKDNLNPSKCRSCCTITDKLNLASCVWFKKVTTGYQSTCVGIRLSNRLTLLNQLMKAYSTRSIDCFCVLSNYYSIPMNHDRRYKNRHQGRFPPSFQLLYSRILRITITQTAIGQTV